MKNQLADPNAGYDMLCDMDYKDALEYFGGTQVRLAKALGVGQPVISHWKGIIPPHYQFQIEVLSDRKLRVDPALLPKVPA